MSQLVLGCIVGAVLKLQAQGFIVPNGVVSHGFDGVGYFVTVRQDPTSGDYTGFDLNPVGRIPPTSPYNNLYRFAVLLDEGVRTFRVSANDPISLEPILAGRYTELTSANTNFFAVGATFYLGFYTGYSPWDSQGNWTGIYRDPLFGWGQFRNNNGVIEMLSSALEFGGGGIYAGTETIIPVPEPSSLALLALGTLGLLLPRRRS